MGKGMCGLLAGLCAGVFVGALGYELAKKTEIGNKVSKSFRSAVESFKEGFRSAGQPSEESA